MLTKPPWKSILGALKIYSKERLDMPITVIRNPKESVDRLVARFNKKVQSSRILLQVKGRRYFKRAVPQRKIRDAAIMRDHYRSQKDKMRFY